MSIKEFLVGTYSDVAVGVSVSPALVSTGDLLQYTISVTNHGSLQAESVVVTDRLPAGLSLFLPPSGADCVQDNDIITCNVGALAHGLEVSIRIAATVTGGPYLTNQVNATSGSPDSDPSNNSTSLLTVLAGFPPPIGSSIPIAASLTGGILQLSWPAEPDEFLLESTTSLVPPTVWSAVAAAPVRLNGRSTVTESTASGTRFYRLRKRG
jgi:uncharacterized repeat protein (TIGR01451 family)